MNLLAQTSWPNTRSLQDLESPTSSPTATLLPSCSPRDLIVLWGLGDYLFVEGPVKGDS